MKVHMVDHFENALAMAASGLGIVFLPRPFKNNSSQVLTYRDVDTKEMFLDYSALWHRENSSVHVTNFLNFLKAEGWRLE